jgi:hypothetical protein
MTLDHRITDFATLVGLVLVLLTLFTGQRAGALRGLETSGQARKRDGVQELALDTVVLAFTVLLFLAGLPIAVEAVRMLHPLAYSGPLRGAFAITWLLLPGLVAWQAILVARVICLMPNLKK